MLRPMPILTPRAVLLLLALLIGCGAPPNRRPIPPPADLPERVVFRDDHQTFNQQHWAALRGGRIWVRANRDTRPKAKGGWHLLGETGLPEGSGIVRGPKPERVVAISGDGIWLMALSASGQLYRGVNFTSASHVEGWFEWTDRWGWPAGQGPGINTQWPLLGWSVSDSHPLGVSHFQDIDGETHGVGLGVAHLYRLSPSGRQIHFNDWWLPADWSRQICGPQRGTFTAINLSASASTIMLISASGEIQTRLYDFDTAGENDLLTYSYITEGPNGTTRALPPEPWRVQPPVPGRVTAKITIFQTGEGNAARTLRVEGQRGAEVGYFEKGIYQDAWTFTATQRALSGPLLDPASTAEPAEPQNLCMRGYLKRQDTKLPIEIRSLNPYCAPAEARLDLGAGQSVVLMFHHTHTLTKKAQPVDGWASGHAYTIRGALVLPKSLEHLPKAARQVLGKRGVINVTGPLSKHRAALDEIMWTTPFRVPANEKAFMHGASLRLRPCTP
jgi:hypothetical protein